jgi:ADP-ribose pyrophosphatase YjhB (NUDIX family)
VGAGALIVHGKRLVLVKRGVQPGKGKWSIPGGAVELGENVRDAVRREAKEETGLDIEMIEDRPLDVVDNILTDDEGRLQFHYVLLQFLARPRSDVLRPAGDVIDARWVAFKDVQKYDLTPSFRSFFNKHKNELGSA